jgi:multisubunit Na+/H+ antiporter MnhB subunit
MSWIMSGVAPFEIALAVLLLAMAIWVVATRTAFAATVGFIVYGLVLSLAWVMLSAVDVALTEAAIGSGLVGMLLLGAAARLRAIEAKLLPASLPLKLAAGALCAIVSAGLAAVVLSPPTVAPTLAPVAMAHLPESGLGNPVTGVLFVYRALDTLLEKVVVVLALIGVWALTPDRAWGGVPEFQLYDQPSGILVLLAQLLPPIGIMLGIYMFWTGADHPGGAFQGGALLAAMWLLVMMARLLPVPPISTVSIRLLVTVGPLVFLAIGLAGFALAGAFLAYPAGYAKPLIIIAETALTLSIGVTLALLVAGPAERRS